MVFADVIVDISVKSLDRPFQYSVPEMLMEDAVIGAQVTIPFGKANRLMKGFIIGLSGTAKYEVSKTKSIVSVEKQGVVMESHLLSLAYWIKERYGSTMNDAIKAVMPVKREIKEKVKRRILPAVSYEEMTVANEAFQKKHNEARVRLLTGLLEAEDYSGGLDYGEALATYHVTAAVVNGLIQKGLILLESERLYRDPVGDRETKRMTPPRLNAEQRSVVESITGRIQSGERGNYYIHGVTGSGKTEVYIRLIENVLGFGKQAIVLIPEIALTFQTVNRFYERFGNQVSVVHSRLSAGERYDQFERAKQGEISIMIGPRSALFTPFMNLGLIIIDEEHENSYQSENPPKYHAREVAIKRGEMLGASVVMGSATPSLEAYYRCEQGEITYFSMPNRATGASLPKVEIVDLREEFAKKNYSIFSEALQQAIDSRLARQEQVMLFLNRRGYAGFVSCRKCGEVIMCDQCSVSMKPHEVRGRVARLKCHYCGAEKQMPTVCPACGSKYIGTFGLGTQQVEELVHKRFPKARVLRMDADTTTGKEGHTRILKAFAEGEADILVGTQMIVKGHDYPNVTLVGVLAADLSLNANDYRGAERTFALLTQAAGRAGRGEKAGAVIFQTYQPEHFCIQTAAKADYTGFYRKEIQNRQILQYPPISHILEVMLSSEKEATAMDMAKKISAQLDAYDEITVLGPVEAPIYRLRGEFRQIIYIKGSDIQMLCGIRSQLEDYYQKNTQKKLCSIFFSLDG